METNKKRGIKLIKAIFFDFDLTLVNSRPGAVASYNVLSKLAGVKATKKGFQEYIGKRFSTMIEDYSKVSGIEKKIFVKEFLKAYISKIDRMKVYGKNLLFSLKKVKRIIITNNNRKAVAAACRKLGLKYDLLIADDDMKKKERKHNSINRMLKKLKLKKTEAVYVGDHVNDVIEAHKSGIKAVIVPTGVFSKKYLKRYHPDFFVNKIDEVKKLL